MIPTCVPSFAKSEIPSCLPPCSRPSHTWPLDVRLWLEICHMTTLARNAIFISHANPEDNEFTVWLGARQTAAGYEVWADVLRLRGGQDWQRLLEDALRNKACKVLLVGTEHGVQKQGVRNEIQIAHTVSRSIGDTEFVIPLRLTNFDAPFLAAHAQYIDFERSWGPRRTLGNAR